MKIDLHVHSKYSERPAIWLLQKLGCPESFLEPKQLYTLLKKKGMGAATITDHNCIEGCLEIADLPNTFISSELTTYFPEDRCKIHVLVWDIQENIFPELQRLRENIYELAAYIHENKINSAVAHPMAAINNRLTPEHFEKLLLLFDNFELNGDQEHLVNSEITRLLNSLKPEDIEVFSHKHSITPLAETPWKKHLVAGSDDHAGIDFANSYTHVPAAESITEFFAGVQRGKALAYAQNASPRSVARNIHSIAYQFIKHKFKLQNTSGADILLRFLDTALEPYIRKDYGILSRIGYVLRKHKTENTTKKEDFSLASFLQREGRKLLLEDPKLIELIEEKYSESILDDEGRMWFDFVKRISNRTFRHLLTQLLESLGKGMIFDIFHTLGSAGSLYLAMAPYFVAYPMFATERRTAEKIRRQSFPNLTPLRNEGASVAYFTDTFFEINGVTRTLRQFLQNSRATGKDMKVITCHANPEPFEGCRSFTPIGEYIIPEYPEMRIYLPPFLEMLDYCYNKDLTHLHASTPGPVGLAALAIGRFLRLPVYSTYHTALPQYVNILTGDSGMEDIAWTYLSWFYNQTDSVLVNSRASADELAAKGVIKEKISIFPRGVDLSRFNPGHSTQQMRARFQADNPNAPRFLYVGRISKEKNLQLLGEAFKIASKSIPDAHMTVIGDGPHLKEMKKSLHGFNVEFTGYVEWQDLPNIYASHGGIFVFPSMTDTFGNVVLEAQACGMPVIVSEVGGPRENIINGETGIMADCTCPDKLAQSMIELGSNPAKINKMRAAAIEYGSKRGFREAFLKMWQDHYESMHQPTEQTDKNFLKKQEYLTKKALKENILPVI